MRTSEGVSRAIVEESQTIKCEHVTSTAPRVYDSAGLVGPLSSINHQPTNDACPTVTHQTPNIACASLSPPTTCIHHARLATKLAIQSHPVTAGETHFTTRQKGPRQHFNGRLLRNWVAWTRLCQFAGRLCRAPSFTLACADAIYAVFDALKPHLIVLFQQQTNTNYETKHGESGLCINIRQVHDDINGV